MNYEKLLVECSEVIKLKGFTEKTRKAYLFNVSKFFVFLKKTSLNLDNTSAKEYLLFLNDRNLKPNSIRLINASILFLFKEVLMIQLSLSDFPKPKKPKLLPKVLSKMEVFTIIESIENKKHKLIVSILYSAGLRLSEVINLKREDLQVTRNVIFVKSGKGQKDRITILSKKVKSQVLTYLIETNFNSKLLFESNRGGKYSPKTIQLILKKTSDKIGKNVTPHMLRHSFATHLLEAGVDIRYIQKLLGHANLETTSIYTNVATNKLEDIKSPFD